jgi:hypothetical protein
MTRDFGGRYILAEDGKTPVRADDLMTWAAWFEDRNKRVVRRTSIGHVLVSTVFLGLDHSFFGDGAPVLWETMIFGGRHAGHQIRASSHEGALRQHRQAFQLAASVYRTANKRQRKKQCRSRLEAQKKMQRVFWRLGREVEKERRAKQIIATMNGDA